GRKPGSLATPPPPPPQSYSRPPGNTQPGDGPSPPVPPAATRLQAPVLAATNVCSAEINLSWSQTGNDHYLLERSFNGEPFRTLADNIPPAQTTYVDTDTGKRGSYAYRVTAFNRNPDDSAVSNTTAVQNALFIVD